MTPLQFEIQLKNYSDYPTSKNLIDLEIVLRNSPLSTLNNFCLQNPIIRILLEHPDFLPFWLKKMEEIKVTGLPDFNFQRTTRLTPMEITLGYFNYFQSLKYPEEATKFIQQALLFHSFHALEQFSQKLIISFDPYNEESRASLSSQISLFEQEAPWHGTPAYLLVAKLYYCFTFAPTPPDFVSAAYLMTLKNLELARLSETESVQDMNNAYFGRSLRTNNPFDLSSLEEIRVALIKQAGNYLAIPGITKANHLASFQHPVKMDAKITQNVILSELYQAILMDSIYLVRSLSKQHEFERRNTWGETPLHFAVRHKKIDSVRCLLSLGADPTQYDAKGINSFRIALETGQLGIGRLLLLSSPKLLDALPLSLAENEASNTLEALKKIPTQKELSTLEKAIQNKDNPMIQKLLEQGLSPNFILPSGRTGFAELFATGNNEGVELFLKYGASLSYSDRQGETILFSLMKIFSSKKERNTIKYYFDYFMVLGTDINVQNKQGETLLIQAVKSGDIEAVAFILQQDNTDLDKKTKDGYSALYYAKKLKHACLIPLLEASGEKIITPKHEKQGASKIMSFFGLRTASNTNDVSKNLKYEPTNF